MAIDSIKNDHNFVELYTRESYDSGDENIHRVIDFGLPVDQIMIYFERLQELINFVKENKTGDKFIIRG